MKKGSLKSNVLGIIVYCHAQLQSQLTGLSLSSDSSSFLKNKVMTASCQPLPVSVVLALKTFVLANLSGQGAAYYCCGLFQHSFNFELNDKLLYWNSETRPSQFSFLSMDAKELSIGEEQWIGSPGSSIQGAGSSILQSLFL